MIRPGEYIRDIFQMVPGTPVTARTRDADGTATASGPVESFTYFPRVPCVMLK